VRQALPHTNSTKIVVVYLHKHAKDYGDEDFIIHNAQFEQGNNDFLRYKFAA
jgi:hypothetical protein